MPTIEMLSFRGLIGNTELQDITGPDFMSALRTSGWREAHNAHIFKRLRERGVHLGIRTPNDLVRAIRRGSTQREADGTCLRTICDGRAVIVYREQTGALITLTFT